jgi:hypothetical protein
LFFLSIRFWLIIDILMQNGINVKHIYNKDLVLLHLQMMFNRFSHEFLIVLKILIEIFRFLIGLKNMVMHFYKKILLLALENLFDKRKNLIKCIQILKWLLKFDLFFFLRKLFSSFYIEYKNKC